MFDDLRLYLLNIRIKLHKMGRDDIPKDLLMEEISQIAINNWVNRESSKPDLTNKQMLKASRRVIGKKYSGN